MSEEKPVITVYGIKNCDTMKKAMAWLSERGLAFAFVDYKKAGVLAAQLPLWCTQVSWEVLLNTKGLTWRKLDPAQKEGMNAEKAMALMLEHPTLVKRPVLCIENQGELSQVSQVLVGFSPERYEEVV